LGLFIADDGYSSFGLGLCKAQQKKEDLAKLIHREVNFLDLHLAWFGGTPFEIRYS
jgi:hypothetical protein